MTPCLVFDADDTLWENNIFFQHAIGEFIALLKPVAPDEVLVRALLHEVEQECIPIGGYGTRNFVYALKETCCRLYKGKDGAGYLQQIEEIGSKLMQHPLHLRPGVLETLTQLHAGNRLMLFSKGDFDEQWGKINRSGLRAFFDRVVIAEEKDTPAYVGLVREHGLQPEHTFMIGNSPRSDILPALAAGLWAVFIPHPHTWELEHHPVEPHERLLHAESIAELPTLLSQHHSRSSKPA
jgi:putative hydrolase of the HAD superfamily